MVVRLVSSKCGNDTLGKGDGSAAVVSYDATGICVV